MVRLSRSPGCTGQRSRLAAKRCGSEPLVPFAIIRRVSASEPDRKAQWWTTSDVAAYLGLRVGTVSSYRQRGQMPAPDATFGRTHVWQPSRIVDWHEGRPRPGIGGRPTSQEAGVFAEDADTGRPQNDSDPRTLLDQAAARVGLDASGAELIRLGSNAVFRVERHPVIGRVALSNRSLDAASREISVARWLAAESVPAVRALDVPQPVLVGERIVTFWESASDDIAYGTTRELAGLLRRLHALESPIELPDHDPFERANSRLASLPPSEDVAYLHACLDELRALYAAVKFELPKGVIHGDANVGNVIRDRDNRPIFADLDNFAVGPREWDLVLTALYFERYGWHSADEYAQFVKAYGYDIMHWSGYPVMRDVRELLMVTWLTERAIDDHAAASELRKRMETLRSGGDRRSWQPL